MGWAGGGGIFDPVCREVLNTRMSQADATRILSALIQALQENDWDTEHESAEEFAGYDEVRAAFRQHDIILECGENNGERGTIRWCERERGPIGHKDGKHEDYEHVTWPAEQVPGV